MEITDEIRAKKHKNKQDTSDLRVLVLDFGQSTTDTGTGILTYVCIQNTLFLTRNQRSGCSCSEVEKVFGNIYPLLWRDSAGVQLLLLLLLLQRQCLCIFDKSILQLVPEVSLPDSIRASETFQIQFIYTKLELQVCSTESDATWRQLDTLCASDASVLSLSERTFTNARLLRLKQQNGDENWTDWPSNIFWLLTLILKSLPTPSSRCFWNHTPFVPFASGLWPLLFCGWCERKKGGGGKEDEAASLLNIFLWGPQMQALTAGQGLIMFPEQHKSTEPSNIELLTDAGSLLWQLECGPAERLKMVRQKGVEQMRAHSSSSLSTKQQGFALRYKVEHEHPVSLYA